jgi:hypothetical protein
MVYLNKDIAADLVFTLTEKETFTEPNYHFICTHRSLNIEVEFFKKYTDNISIHKDRYDLIIFTGGEFGSAPDGEYVYTIFEQDETTGLDGALLETGILRLNPINSVSYEVYQTDNTFVTR